MVVETGTGRTGNCLRLEDIHIAMGLQQRGASVVSNKTAHRQLIIENRQLKIELAEVALEAEQMRQSYSRSNLKCIEKQIRIDDLVEENRRLNELLSKVESQLASVGKLIERGTIKSAGMPQTKPAKRRRSTRSFPDIGGGLWRHLNRNADLGGRGRAPSNKNLATSDARTQLYTDRTSTSWEVTVPEALVFAKSTPSKFEEAEERLPESEEEMVVQMSSDIEMGSDDGNDWQYETPGATAPTELFLDEDSKKDVLVEVIPSEFEEVRSKETAVSLVSERSPNAFEPRTLSELVAPAPEISFQCYICKEEFASNTKLDNHMRRVCFRRFESIRCSRKFTEMSDLSRHIQSHPEEKVFHCEYQSCGKSFTNKFYLIQHTRIHPIERPYQCEYPGCMKRFNQP